MIALVLSAVGAAAVSFARAALEGRPRRRFGVAVSAVLIAWTLVNLWAPLLAEGLPVRAYGSLRGDHGQDGAAAGNLRC